MGEILFTGNNKSISFYTNSSSCHEKNLKYRNIFLLVVGGSVSPPTPTSIIHLMSIGFESLVLETWLDLRSGDIHF